MKWWEKTVEYYFLQKWVDNAITIAPLDGKHEQSVGDALVEKDAKFIMIEFKKDKNCISQEKKKFGSNFEYAKSMLEDRDQHHFLVYGYEDEIVYGDKVIGNEFILISENFFSRGNATTFDEMMEHGIGLSEFNEYIQDFARLKETGSGGGGKLVDNSSILDVNDYQFVLSIITNETQAEVTCMTLEEACHELKTSVVAKPDHTPGPPSRKPKMM